MIETCRFCTKRHMGCHSVCKDYLNAKAVHNRQKSKIAKEKRAELDCDRYEKSRTKRIKKKTRSERM